MADTVGEINGALDSILENCAKLDARIDAMTKNDADRFNRRFTGSGSEKASQSQISEIRRLAELAGYTGDRAYNAAEELLGDGRGWSSSP